MQAVCSLSQHRSFHFPGFWHARRNWRARQHLHHLHSRPRLPHRSVWIGQGKVDALWLWHPCTILPKRAQCRARGSVSTCWNLNLDQIFWASKWHHLLVVQGRELSALCVSFLWRLRFYPPWFCSLKMLFVLYIRRLHIHHMHVPLQKPSSGAKHWPSSHNSSHRWVGYPPRHGWKVHP